MRGRHRAHAQRLGGLTKAKAILVIGSNITETNPLTAVRIKEAIRVYKAQVIVVDSANTNMAQLASHPMLVKPGTEGLVHPRAGQVGHRAGSGG